MDSIRFKKKIYIYIYILLVLNGVDKLSVVVFFFFKCFRKIDLKSREIVVAGQNFGNAVF